MLDIAFLILKILGIILLAILGILTLVISVVILFPAKYRIVADADGEVKDATVYAKMYWLFHLVSAEVSYKNQEFRWKARFLWMTENDFEKEKVTESIKNEENFEDQLKDDFEKNFETDHYFEKEEIKQERLNSKNPKTKTKFRELLDKIRYTFRKICDRIRQIIKVKDEVVAFFNSETHRSTLQKVKNEFLIIIKHYRPRKLKGYVKFGFDDPYHTGQTLAVLSLIYPFYGKDVQIQPDFDKKLLEGHLVVTGYVRVVHLLRLVFLWLFDRDVKQTYEYFAGLLK